VFFEDITKLIRSFKNKLKIEGYLNGLDKKVKEKTAVEITYAYIIQFILYKTLVDNEFGNFGREFENIVEAIHKCLNEKRYKDILGIIDGISAQISKNIYRPFSKEQEFINRKLLKLYRSLENKLSDVSAWLDIFVFIKKYDFANIENEIFGYIYENYLKELYAEGKKGQYFTDPAVVNFMLQQIGFTPKEIEKAYKKDKNCISLIDPACGSGTFLYSAVNEIMKAFGDHTEEKSKQIEEIVNKNIFGLDIEEFPLYLAEMNMLMRMLPWIITEKYNNPVDKKIKVFLTKDSISEFMDTGLKHTRHDFELRDRQINLFKELDLGYTSYVRENTDLEEMKKSLEEHPQIPRRRFDYVIGNPPYVSFKELSKQKVLIFTLIT
jgi:type I restriction-modification system DNA methylase subunit